MFCTFSTFLKFSQEAGSFNLVFDEPLSLQILQILFVCLIRTTAGSFGKSVWSRFPIRRALNASLISFTINDLLTGLLGPY